MDPTEVNRLFDALVRAGWTWRDGSLVAPHGTMWLDGKEPWPGDVRSFYERMIGRVARLRNNLEGLVGADAVDVEQAARDVAGLVEALGTLLGP